ncbi:MAG: kelch repeat-containing protein [Planctomycetota bacterium]
MKTILFGAIPIALTSLCQPLAAQDWVRVAPDASSPRATYDVLRQDFVLVGQRMGGPADLQSWRGNPGPGIEWRQLPALPLNASTVGNLTYDIARDRVIALLSQPDETVTYEFDNVTWTRVNTATRPPSLRGAAFAFDLVRGRAVLFGGRNTSTLQELDETWEYDGVDWTLRRPATSPSPRSGAAMAFDLRRGQMLMFGGRSGVSILGDTWSYDGSSWRPEAPTTRPPDREFAALGCDQSRGRMVLFGGLGQPQTLADTWEWNGADWTAIATPHTPPARYEASMDLDWSRGVCVLHAGRDRTVFLSDSWEFDGVDWTLRTQALLPTRFDFDLALDCWSGRVIVFGGSDMSTTLRDDTWATDGPTWQRVGTATAPSARRGHRMVTDLHRERVVLFGGTTANGIVGDTWQFDGTTWTQVATAGPQPRSHHAMAYDSIRRRAVLFGGSGSSLWNDTWEFDGATWAAIPASTAPIARRSAAMAFDPTRARCVLVGGSDAQFATLADTWEFDGSDWRLSAPPLAPPPLQMDLAFDPLQPAIVMVGNIGGVLETWHYDGAWTSVSQPARGYVPRAVFDSPRNRLLRLDASPTGVSTMVRPAPATATFARGGVGCPGSASAPSLDAAPGGVPALGTTMQLQFAALPAQPGALVLAFGFDLEEAAPGLRLPAPLDAIGRPDCLLWTSIDLPFFVPHNGGAAAFALAIPNDPNLDGLVVGAQAFVFDPLAPGGSGSVTNGAVLLLR